MSPRDQERLYKKEYALELLAIAEGDLESASLLAEASERKNRGRKVNVIFLVQQAIEKAIKAVLCWHKQPIPLVHDLGILVAKLPEGLSPPEGYRLTHLNEYATVRRYERGGLDLSSKDVSVSLDLGTRVLDWAKKELTS